MSLYALLASWYGLGLAHEIAHLVVACAVGVRDEALTAKNISSAFFERRIVVKTTSLRQEYLIRQAGWATSVVLALCLYVGQAMPTTSSVAIGAMVVALEAVSSDLLGIDFLVLSPDIASAFNCGNFGVILVKPTNRQYVINILKRMVEVTIM